MLSQPASVRIKHKFLYIKDLCDLGVLCGDESGLTTHRGRGLILSLVHIGLWRAPARLTRIPGFIETHRKNRVPICSLL